MRQLVAELVVQARTMQSAAAAPLAAVEALAEGQCESMDLLDLTGALRSSVSQAEKCCASAELLAAQCDGGWRLMLQHAFVCLSGGPALSARLSCAAMHSHGVMVPGCHVQP